MGPHLWDARRIPLPDWLPAGTVHLDPRAGTVRQRTQAQVLGRVRLPTGEWATLYSSGGPAPASLRDRGARSLQVRHVYDPRGPGPGIRALRPEEYASVKGLPEPDREWDLPGLRELLRAPAPQAAARALSTAARGPTPVESAGKRGGARDPEEDWRWRSSASGCGGPIRGTWEARMPRPWRFSGSALRTRTRTGSRVSSSSSASTPGPGALLPGTWES